MKSRCSNKTCTSLLKIRHNEVYVVRKKRCVISSFKTLITNFVYVYDHGRFISLFFLFFFKKNKKEIKKNIYDGKERTPFGLYSS
jgi:hypothetical protein